MIKKFISVFFVILFIFSNVYANNAVDTIISDETKYVILATITNVTDNSFELTRGYGVKYPEWAIIPDTFNVNKFKYGYCVEHADNYNNPQMGDNIIVAMEYANGVYNVVSAAFMVDNVSSSAKVKVPENLKKYKCLNELLALGYYIHSDGERTEYEYTDDEKVYAVGENGEKFEINAHKDDYVVFYDKNNALASEGEVTPQKKAENMSNYLMIFLSIGIIIGLGGIWLINFLLNRKEGE
ncbi:MAG: hypothetical protein E7404_01220 [Ruminococcaceae bacterium]|nr:hypothetical protein [Oscillospiraceae bacterium]